MGRRGSLKKVTPCCIGGELQTSKGVKKGGDKDVLQNNVKKAAL